MNWPVASGLCAMLALGAAAPDSAAQAPAPNYLVATLPPAVVGSRNALAGQLLLSRREPAAAARLAESFLAQARATAQPQLYGRAESVLTPWITRPDAPATLLILEADVLQQRHEFTRSVGFLDRAIARDPRSGRAHLMRANVRIVTGAFAQARGDCAWLLASADQWTGSVCLAQVLGATGRLNQARGLLERLAPRNAALSNSPATSASVSWFYSVRADLAIRAGALSDAEAMLKEALTLTPSSDYVRLALADVLIAQARYQDALALLQAARPSAGALLRQGIALARIHDARLATVLNDLRERLTVSSLRGERMHLREETALALEFSSDQRSALRLARDNFSVQRETEDVRLFARAAKAARETEALSTLRVWRQRTGYEDVLLDDLLGAAASTANTNRRSGS